MTQETRTLERFHVNDGLYFSRLKNGNVLIEKYENYQRVLCEEIDKDGWVSVIASVAGDRNGQEYAEAEALHHE